mmetsp:Transcript_67478/g.187040  ORF Transcript_67478/g.187040 Transcript_67478/m.187040 type:complete len:203 (-) Transcript_67478:94-702(-)
MSVSFGDVYNPPAFGGLSARPHPLPASSDPLDWECPNKMCRNINFKKRPKCNICGTPKPSNARQDPRYERAKAEAQRLNGNGGEREAFVVEWFCALCEAPNTASDERCRECQASRLDRRSAERQAVERAGGKAGGFFDRNDPGDRRKWDSETEDVDEFGRKKKAAPESKGERRKAALERLYSKGATIRKGTGLARSRSRSCH